MTKFGAPSTRLELKNASIRTPIQDPFGGPSQYMVFDLYSTEGDIRVRIHKDANFDTQVEKVASLMAKPVDVVLHTYRWSVPGGKSGTAYYLQRIEEAA